MSASQAYDQWIRGYEHRRLPSAQFAFLQGYAARTTEVFKAMPHHQAAARLRRCGAVRTGQGWLIAAPIEQFLWLIECS